MSTRTLTYINLGTILYEVPDLKDQLGEELLSIMLDDVSFGDADFTLITLERFVKALTDMCNDDYITEDTYSATWDYLDMVQDQADQVYVNLER